MFYIKLENDESLVITIKEPIYRGENLNQKIIYLIPTMIDDIDVSTSRVYLNYIRADGTPNVVKLEPLDLKYNEDYYQYTLPVDCKITSTAGDVCTWLHFIPNSTNRVIAKSGECILTIENAKNIEDYDKDGMFLPDLQDRVAFAETDIENLKKDTHVHGNIDELSKINPGDIEKWNSISVNPPKDGEDGVSVVYAEINENNELVFYYSDGTQNNLGVVVGTNGDNGKSAYEAAVEEGFEGTLSDWLLSLRGQNGTNGLSAYEIAKNNGFEGSEEDWFESLRGKDGDSGVGRSVLLDGYDGDIENQPLYSEIFNDYKFNKDNGYRCVHIEGCKGEALNGYAHVEGSHCKAGYCAHAEGTSTQATGMHSHSEGNKTKATGDHSHAQNNITEAHGNASSAAGYGTIAREDNQAVFGSFNSDSPDAIFIIGNGRNNSNRSNAFEVLKDGTVRANKLEVDEMRSGRYQRPFIVDFKTFASEAAKQGWWEDLNDPINTSLVGRVKNVGVIKDGSSATAPATAEAMDAWMKSDLNWHITNFIDRATGYYNAYGGHTIAMDPTGEYYGIKFYPYGSRANDQTKRTLQLTVYAPAAGRYKMSIDSFFEVGSAVTDRLVPNPWNYRTGAYVDVIVNGTTLVNEAKDNDYANFTLGYTAADAEPGDVTLDLGTVALTKGANTVSIDVVQGFWGQGCDINLSNITFIPEWVTHQIENIFLGGAW